MTTMSLFSPPILNSAPVIVYSSSSSSRIAALDSSILSFACCCAPSASSSYSSKQISFRGTMLAGTSGSCVGWSRKGRSGLCVAQNSSNATSADTEQRTRLKQELLNLLEATEGSLSGPGTDLIATLEKFNPNPEPSKVPELVNGCFQTVKSTLKGKDAANAGVFSSTFTLGRVAFGAFKPLKQEVFPRETYNHVGYAKDNEYTIAMEISIKNNDGESPEQLEGYLINQGRYSFVEDSKQMTVEFLSSVLRPVNPDNESELRSWKQLFQEQNPSMDERGFMTVELPGYKGSLDHLYLDDELRIVRGNMNNTFVVRRLPGPAIPL